MDCKGLFSRGFSSFEEIVFPETKLADYINKSCHPSHNTAIAISVLVSFFMGLLKIVVLPVAFILGIITVPIKAVISFFQSQRLAHYLITWLLCVLSTALLVVLLAALALFAPANVLFSCLGVSIALLVGSSFIYFSDRFTYETSSPTPLPPSGPVIIEST